MSPPVRVAVVGGGIAGLAAAHALRTSRSELEVVVLESAPRVGGKLLLGEVGGVTVDLGAESMLNRRPEGVELARAIGLGDRVVHPRTTAARIWSRATMRPLPRSLLGVPADARDLARSRLLSPAGLARAGLDLLLPPMSLEEDIGIGDLVERRFGTEVVDRLVEPLLGGVYAGHAREISAQAAAPQVVALSQRGRSLGRAAAAALRGGDDRPVFAGLAGGVGQLPAALARTLEVRTASTVRHLQPAPDGRWQLTVGPTTVPEVVHADAVVLAVPAPAAARLLSEAVPRAAAELSDIEYASVAVISMAFDRSTVPALPGSGFLVPPVDARDIKAATFVSAKWGWVDESAPDTVVIRTSVGRHREERSLQATDEELVARSVADLQRATGITSRPVDAVVQRWGGGLPQYAVGHLDRVRRVRASVAAHPGLAVCGAAYDGVGIPACIASGRAAAAQVLAELPARARDAFGRPGE